MSKAPPFICIYAQSGIGKTTDMGFAFPHALFLANAGATKSIVSTCGYTPREQVVHTVAEATHIVQQMSDGQIEGDTIVIDDFSYMVEASLSKFEEKYTGWTVYSKLRDEIFRFRRVAREANITVALNCWLSEPKTLEDGSKKRGCPKLPSDYGETIPAMCDLVLRGDAYRSYKPHPYAYYCDSSPEWVGKDRDGGTPNPSPMNLGEILRLNGYDVPRLVEWQEEKVENISQMIEADGKKILGGVYQTLLEHLPNNQHLAYWTVRDAQDRYTLRKTKANRWTNIKF